MKSSPHTGTHDASPAQTDEPAAYRPDSASIIHTVANRRSNTAGILDRETTQREQVERNNVSLLLHALHESGENHVPAEQRRLVREAEVQRAIAVLRRFNLLHPSVRLDQILDHCERATALDRDPVAHLVDPFQLRHVLSYHEGIPHEELTSADLCELDRIVENGPDAGIAGWFAQLGARIDALPKSTPACLRTVFERACAKRIPAARIELFAFELAVLTLRIQGPIGLEDTRLFFSLIKQIEADGIQALSGFLDATEANHAVVQHQAVGNTAATTYFRQFASDFDHNALGKLEQRLIDAANQPNAARPKGAVPSTGATSDAITAGNRSGFLSGLRSLGQSLFARG